MIDLLLLEHGDALCEQMAQSVHGADAALAPGWGRQLLDAFEAELRGTGVGLFSTTLEGLLAAVARAGDDVATWQGLITALRRLLLPALTGEPSRWLLAEDLWHEARVLIGNLAEGAFAQQRLKAEGLARTLAESSAALLAIHEVPLLLRAVAEQLPRLGIPGAWLSLFAGSDEQPAALARLALAYDQAATRGVSLLLPAADTPPFAAEMVVPDAVRPTGRRLAIVVEPLFFNARPLGFLALELGPPEGLVYTSLAEQVSSAVEGARLGDQLADQLVPDATRPPGRLV